MQFSKKKRLPRLIIDFKSKKMMKEFVKDAFQGSIETIQADYLHLNPKNYNVDIYTTKRVKA